MTTELEHEIRAAFAEVVPAGADPALATSIRARLTETPVVRRGPASIVGWLAAAAVIVAVVVVAVPLLGRSSQAGPSSNPGQVIGGSPSAGPSTGPAASAHPSATASPASATLAPEAIAVQKQLFGDVAGSTFRLINDDVGWVAAGRTLYRTADGGRTWTDSRVPSPGVTDPEYGETGSAISIVDADTAYVGYSEGTLVGTHDAGRSWSTVRVYEHQHAVGLSFLTPMSGSATFPSGLGYIHVRWTDDGGRTWAGPYLTALPDGQSKTNPISGNVVSLNVGKADGKPFNDHLWLSTDGGRTWPERTFPIDSVAPAGTLKWLIGTPWVEDGGRIILPIAVDGGQNAIYQSSDDGKTWGRIRDWPQPDLADFRFQALSGTEWVLTTIDGSDTWSTTNGGADWREVRGTETQQELSTSWASVDHGWGLHVCSADPAIPPSPDPYCDGNPLKSVLLETIDGGATWTPIGG